MLGGRPRRGDVGRGPAPGHGVGGEQVEGRQAVAELLAAGRRGVTDVWMAQDLHGAPILDRIEKLATEARVTEAQLVQERNLKQGQSAVERDAIRRPVVRFAIVGEEVLRIEGSTKQTARLARRDTKIGNVAIPAGTKILVALSAFPFYWALVASVTPEARLFAEPTLWPAEPVKWIRMVSSGNPAAPWRSGTKCRSTTTRRRPRGPSACVCR